jgi:hypothetical protein
MPGHRGGTKGSRFHQSDDSRRPDAEGEKRDPVLITRCRDYCTVTHHSRYDEEDQARLVSIAAALGRVTLAGLLERTAARHNSVSIC